MCVDDVSNELAANNNISALHRAMYDPSSVLSMEYIKLFWKESNHGLLVFIAFFFLRIFLYYLDRLHSNKSMCRLSSKRCIKRNGNIHHTRTQPYSSWANMSAATSAATISMPIFFFCLFCFQYSTRFFYNMAYWQFGTFCTCFLSFSASKRKERHTQSFCVELL